MFNRSVYFGGSDTNIKVNAVSGGIVKNHKDSFFLRFHLNSKDAERLLSPKPNRIEQRHNDYGYRDVIVYVEVLQLVIVGDSMREIKFRAWDGERMHHFGLSDISANGSVTGSEHGCIDLFNGECKGDIMQYSGLKDKNGVEIYEGDIIAAPFCNHYLPVEWHSVSWTVNIGPLAVGLADRHSTLDSWASTSEVIGNIYENGDLLK